MERLKVLEVNYLIFGKEKGEQGTEHLQGYVELPKKLRLKGVKEMIGQRAHLEVAKGNAAQNKEYCSKGEDIFEKGQPTQNGKISLTAMVTSYAAGRTSTEMKDLFGNSWTRHKKKIVEQVEAEKRDLEAARVKEEMRQVVLRDWQSDALNRLKCQNNRQILFIIDPVGNSGKSFFANYLRAIFGAFMCDTTKYADVLYAYDSEKYVAIDLCPQMVEYLNYGTLETLKDGFGFSPKYRSCMKHWPPAKVIVFTRNNVDETKMSRDRYDIRYIKNNTLI